MPQRLILGFYMSLKRDILEKADKVGYFNNCRNVKNVINSKINNYSIYVHVRVCITWHVVAMHHFHLVCMHAASASTPLGSIFVWVQSSLTQTIVRSGCYLHRANYWYL
jgi:hypothetical protein